MSYRIALASLAQSLPELAHADLESDARGLLRLVVQAAVESGGGIPVATDAGLCPNCDAPTAADRSPYCGEFCRDQAALVRQIRAGVPSSLLDPERQIAVGQSLWHLLGGGYPLRQSLVPERARLLVISKNGGLCEACGRSATQIDHRRTACNRPINLRPVCEACNQDRPFGDPDVMTRPEFAQVLKVLATRIGADQPLRVCDDAESWDWRAYLRERNGTQ